MLSSCSWKVNPRRVAWVVEAEQTGSVPVSPHRAPVESSTGLSQYRSRDLGEEGGSFGSAGSVCKQCTTAELVTREDLRDLSRLTSWRGPADLVELLRERVARPTNFDNLAQSLGVSPPTSKAWVELLEKLYIVFLLPPYSDSLARSIRKDRRIYFFDCAAAYDETGAPQLENLVACSLLKFTQFRKDAFGENWGLYYLRDKEDREVDFVVTRNRRVHWLIEVKSSDADLSRALKYYTDKLKPVDSIQLVRNLDRPLEKSGCKILPLGEWAGRSVV
jgi:predicted AAA+ superfamily ATPase